MWETETTLCTNKLLLSWWRLSFAQTRSPSQGDLLGLYSSWLHHQLRALHFRGLWMCSFEAGRLNTTCCRKQVAEGLLAGTPNTRVLAFYCKLLFPNQSGAGRGHNKQTNKHTHTHTDNHTKYADAQTQRNPEPNFPDSSTFE